MMQYSQANNPRSVVLKLPSAIIILRELIKVVLWAVSHFHWMWTSAEIILHLVSLSFFPHFSKLTTPKIILKQSQKHSTVFSTSSRAWWNPRLVEEYPVNWAAAEQHCAECDVKQVTVVIPHQQAHIHIRTFPCCPCLGMCCRMAAHMPAPWNRCQRRSSRPGAAEPRLRRWRRTCVSPCTSRIRILSKMRYQISS